MSRRSQSWNEGLAKDLRKPAFAQAFVIALLEDGYSLHEALSTSIRAYGIKEFAEKTGMASANLSRVITKDHNPSRKVMEELLKYFGLRLGAMPMQAIRKKRAA